MSQEELQAQPKTGKAEKTRAVIAEAAMRLFQEHGYEATAARLITLARFPVFRTVARQLLAVADMAREPQQPLDYHPVDGGGGPPPH